MTAARQLSLFKSRRQRGMKPPPAPEFKTHCALADTLRIGCSPGWWWSHIGHGERRDPATAARLKRLGVRAGMADLILLGPHGVHFLELKRPPNRLTDDQQQFRDAARRAGAIFETAFSYEEAITFLKKWGALRDALHVSG